MAGSPSSANTQAFYREAKDKREVWYLVAEGKGMPTARTASGGHAVPFWSTERRAQRVADSVPGYASYEVGAMTLLFFLETTLPDLAANDLEVGLNWSGKRATGYSFEAATVLSRFEVAEVD